MTHEKTDVEAYLSGADFPASATHLAALADREGAPEQMQAVLRSFGDRQFDGPAQVAEVLAEAVDSNGAEYRTEQEP